MIDGVYRINYTPKTEVPVTEWMALQGRFKHLLKPVYNNVVAAFQQEVDRNWNWLAKQEELSVLLAGFGWS